jgi:hypothetical protein
MFPLLLSFPNTFPLPLVPDIPLGRAYSTLSFSNFVGKKREKIK